MSFKSKKDKSQTISNPNELSEEQWHSLYQMASPKVRKQMLRDLEKMEPDEETEGAPKDINLGNVIDNQRMFSTSLGFNTTDELLGSSVFGILSGVAIGVTVFGALTASAAATSAAAAAAALAGLSFFGKIGLALGFVTISVETATVPILVPITIGAASALGVGTITYFIRTKGKKFSTYGGYRSFNTNIDRLGHSIAGKIFIPIIGLIKESGNENYDFVIEEMKKWGYARQYIDTFVITISKWDIAIIKKSIAGYNDWIKKETKKQVKKLNKKDIDLKVLNSKIKDLAKKYINEFGGSDSFMKFIEENCR